MAVAAAGEKEEIGRAAAVGREGAPAAVRGRGFSGFHLCPSQYMVVTVDFVAVIGGGITTVDPK